MNIAAPRFTFMVAIATLVLAIVLASAPVESLHGHAQLSACAICQLAHLPAIQSGITVISAVLEPVAGDFGPGAGVSVSEDAQTTAIPRAPPILHAL